MAPTSTQATPPASLGDETFRPLAPLDGAVQLPTTALLERTLMEQFRTGLAALRDARGEVHKPEDTHEVIRTAEVVKGNLQAVIDVLVRVQDECAEAQRAEAIAAHGVDENGDPRKNMAVPFDGMTIRLTRETSSQYRTDPDQIHAAAAALVERQWTANGLDATTDPIGFARDVAGFITEDIRTKSDAKVKGIDALAATLGHHGLDTMASAVRDAHVKLGTRVTRYSVKVESPTANSSRPPLLTPRLRKADS